MISNRTKITQIKDWSYVDYLCMKAKEAGIHADVYYLEGHSEFEKSLTLSDMQFMEFAYSIGIYGISEKMIGESNVADRFYIRVNISNKQQEVKLINYLSKKKEISDEQKQILKQLCAMNSIINNNSDYRSLYYCGFSQNNESINYDSVRFYFKTFGVNESSENNNEYIHYCEQCLIIKNDPIFQIIKELVATNKVGLRCIGVDIADAHSMKVKYYLSGVDIENNIIEILLKLKKYPRWRKNIDKLLESISDMSNLCCKLLQISGGYTEDRGSINMYLDGKTEEKKKYYSIREGLVLRDIGGIGFLIDIYEKHYYDLKNLLSVNETGRTIIEYIMQNGVCTLDGIVSNLRLLIKDYRPEMYPEIYCDCKMFVEQLKSAGYLQEVV